MRRRVVSVALLVALALACAGRAEARGFVLGGQQALGSDQDQAALVSAAHRDQLLARPLDRRASKSPHGPAPAFLPAAGTGPAGPSRAVLARAQPAPGTPSEDTSGSTRTSRGPPRPTAAFS